MNNELIFEGARAGDLQYLVSTYVSIDQYSTKITKDNIVVSFFVKDEEPAHDFMEFISKNFYNDIIDIEISQSKTINGDYQLFIEFIRYPSFPNRFMHMINAISLLTGNKKWVFKTKGNSQTFDLTEENLKKRIRLTPLKKNPRTEDFILQLYGKEKHYEMVPISEYKFNKIMANAPKVNDMPTIEFIEIAQQHPEYDITIINGKIYLHKQDKTYVLIEKLEN